MNAQAIAEALHGRRSGSQYMAPCPSHDDRSPSLSIRERDGKVLVHCHAGCDQADVIEALRSKGLWPEKERQEPSRQKLGAIVAEYLYRDEEGQILFRVTRHEPKTFRAWRRDGDRWKPGIGGVRRVLYRLPEVIEAPIVFIVEGEKDVEALREHGFVATCNPGGAGKWRDDYGPVFRGRTVIVVPDSDEAGKAHAAQVIDSIRPYAISILRFNLTVDGVKDIAEWFARGHSEVELVTTLEQAWSEGVAHG